MNSNKNYTYLSYFLMYVFLVLNKSALFSILGIDDKIRLLMYSLILIICLIAIYFLDRNILFSKNKLILIFIYCFLLLISSVYTNMSTSLQSVINKFILIFIIILILEIIGEHFNSIYIKLVNFLSIISWVGFFLEVTGIARYFYKYLFSFGIPKSAFYQGGGILYMWGKELHIYRNCGIYSEPGVHVIILFFSLFLLLFTETIQDNKTRKRYIIINIITIITSGSTTGYMLLLIFLFIYTLSKSFKAACISIIVIIPIVIVCSKIEYFQVMFFRKIAFDINDFNFEWGSGVTRLDGILTDIKIFLMYPLFGAGFYNYRSLFGEITSIPIINGIIPNGTAGLVSLFATDGLFVGLFYLVSSLRNIIKNSVNRIQIVVLIIFFVFITMTQPSIYLSIPILIFYGFKFNRKPEAEYQVSSKI